MGDKKIGVGFGIMLLKGKKILLGRRHDNPEKADSELNGAGKWTMPGGKLHFGEKFEQGAKRELLEETGMALLDAKVICVNQDMVEGAHFITIGLLSTNFKGKPKIMEPDEITNWAWFDIEDLPKPLYFPSKKVLENYKQGKFYIPN